MIMKEYNAPNRTIAQKILAIIQRHHGFNIRITPNKSSFTIGCVFPSRAMAALASAYIAQVC